MDKKNIINERRRAYSKEAMSEPAFCSLSNSIKILADDLYSKEMHFVFELIQNAEDNSYKKNVSPSLQFRLEKVDILGTEQVSLIIENNEIGFEESNIKSLCAVGESTKKKSNGYIGEKGIGFKSVFKITNCPCIFSNEFSFSLPSPEYGEGGLGYIVPEWIDDKPEWVNPETTTIILPLSDAVPPEQICSYLKEISPETILFLNKLEALKINVCLDDTKYEISIKKELVSESIVRLSYVYQDADSEGENEETIYWQNSKEFCRPEGVKSDKRNGVDKRTVSVALPLDGKAENQKLFAYLPVWENTGLPFLINADFLLVSSREGLHENEPWNIWLRDQIPSVYCEAFLDALKNKALSLDQKRNLYATIPFEESNEAFLDPIINNLHQGLSCCESVLSDSGKCKLPANIFSPRSKFRELLGGGYPQALSGRRMVDLFLEEKYEKELKLIGVNKLANEELEACFRETPWLEIHDWDWLLQCYRFLFCLGGNWYELREWPIVPVASGGKVTWHCSLEENIYFECSGSNKATIEDIPRSCRSDLLFLPEYFWCKVKNDEDLCRKMEDALSIHHFANLDYLAERMEWAKENYRKISADDIISLTIFSARFDDGDWGDEFPVVTDNGNSILAIPATLLVFQVTAESENGWAVLFPQEKDRGHFSCLSNEYFRDEETRETVRKFFRKKGVKDVPPPIPRASERQGSQGLTEYETDCLSKFPRPCAVHDNYLSPPRIRHFNSFSESKKGEMSNCLIEWLKSLKKLKQYAKLSVEYLTPTRRDLKSFDSEFIHFLKSIPWVPSTKGLCLPSNVFVRSPEIEDTFGEDVPYLDNEFPKDLIEPLGIVSCLSFDLLVLQLKKAKSGEVQTIDNLSWIYRRLEKSFSDESVRGFKAENLIFIPQTDTQGIWVTADQCIWDDVNGVLADVYHGLSAHYGGLRVFFVEKLGVKESVGSKELISILKEHSAEKRDIGEAGRKIYQQLNEDLNIDSEELSQLRRFKSIFVPQFAGGALWFRPADCIWTDVGDVLGDQFVYLEPSYLEEHRLFFVDKLKIKENADNESYANAWLKIQDSETLPDKNVVEKIYRKLRSTIVQDDENRPLWFREFISNVLLYTQSEKFADQGDIYLPDDGELRELFAGKVSFAWKPPNDSFSDWNSFFAVFGVSRISNSVEMELLGGVDSNPCRTNQYLTPSATKLIASWLREKHSKKYQALLDDGVFHRLFQLKEASVSNEMIVRFALKNTEASIEKSYPVFWDEKNARLFLIGGVEKDDVSYHLASKIFGATNHDLANWISLVLTASNLDCLKRRNWSVPQEVLDIEKELFSSNKNDDEPRKVEGGHGHSEELPPVLLESKSDNNIDVSPDSEDVNSSDELDFEESAPSVVRSEEDSEEFTGLHQEDGCESESLLSNGEQQVSVCDTPLPDEEAQEVITNEIEITGALENSFTRNGTTVIKEKYGERDASTVKKPQVRTEKEIERIRVEKEIPPPPIKMKIVHSVRTKNPQIRQSLLERYSGKCQICDKTWAKWDGVPYFEAVYFIKTKAGAWLDYEGNAICLCAEHAAQWEHAVKEPIGDVVEQIKAQKLEDEGGTTLPSIKFRILGKPVTLSYTEKHFVALRALLESAKSI